MPAKVAAGVGRGRLPDRDYQQDGNQHAQCNFTHAALLRGFPGRGLWSGDFRNGNRSVIGNRRRESRTAAKRPIQMKELKLNPVDGPAMSDKIYALALARIEAVMGCTEDSPEEAELVLWAEIADAHERTSGTVTVDTAGLAVHQGVTKNSPPRPKLGGLRLRTRASREIANAGGRHVNGRRF